MAYNLADIPAVQVGEQIALVLMPSMAELPQERRARALERSTALLSLIIFPLAVGLGLIAYPLIALILPANEWQLVAPLLVVLACLSVFRPIVVGAVRVPRGGVEDEPPDGPRAREARAARRRHRRAPALRHSCRARVPSASSFGVTAIAGVMLVMREGPSPRRLLAGFFQPLAACALMAAAVYGVRTGLVALGWTHPALLLVAMIAIGAAIVRRSGADHLPRHGA